MTDLKITLTPQSRISEVDFKNIPFGRICTDHMFSAEYVDGEWKNYEIKPVEPYVLHPTTIGLHYGQSIFEGMKASVSSDGTPLLFRPELHARRLNHSAERMCMPPFPEEDFLMGLHKLLALDKAWIPPYRGSSLYIRPLMFATEAAIGVKISSTYQFNIMMLPAGPYYEKPVALLAETEYIRAVEGGVGEAKCAGNYAAALYPTKLAVEKGFDQVLWLDPHHFKLIQEVGTMNIFFVIDGVVVTPEAAGTILRGITRYSIIDILRDKGFEVEIRPLTIDEVVKAYDAGKLDEVFGSGTAALVANVSRIRYRDKDMVFDPDKWNASIIAREEINGLRDGSIEDTRGWIVPVEEDILVS